MSAILPKIKKTHRKGAKRPGRKLILALKSRLSPYLKGLKYIFHDPAAKNVILHSPNYVEPSKDNDTLSSEDATETDNSSPSASLYPKGIDKPSSSLNS